MTRTRRSEQFARAASAIVIPDRVALRAATHYVEDADGCYISTYSTGSHGYAQIGWKDEGHHHTVTAHRASWVYSNDGQIPEGMTVDHTCKKRRCVNPAHLRLLTNHENARRTSGRDWPAGQCAHGHPNSELVQRGGKWVCRLCSAEWQRRYRAKKRRRT